MEADQILCKFAKIRNGGYASKIASEREKMDDEEEEGDKRRSNSNNSGGGGAADLGGGAANGLYGCPSSLIVRVSKATRGKDRHSKVITSRGLRDRRVRLSVNTAIQFYDLQDRLGYDQPSKAVEWLLTAAAGSIAELPPMNSPFPVITKPPSEEKMAAEDGASQLVSLQSVMDGSGNAATKSSSSETSKGLGVSISRSESRVRARESAKEGAVEIDKENGEFASFTELLSGGVKCINGGGGGGGASICRNQSQLNNENSEQSSFFPNVPMDYFSNALSSSSATTTPMQIAPPLLFAAPASHHHELQPFSFASDHLLSATNTVNSSTINRGTLQSNVSSPPPNPHFPPNFFPAANHSHFIPGFDAPLQLYDGDANGKNEGRYSEPKRKDKP